MENQRRIWHRLMSRLRGTSTSFSPTPRPSFSQGDQLRLSSVVGTCMPGHYSQYMLRDYIHTRPQSESRSWYAPNFRALASQAFTPKCLAGFNAQNILFGLGSFDDFSPSCWLENHLHRFGALPTEASDTNSYLSNTTENSLPNLQAQTSLPLATRLFNSRFSDMNNTYSSSSGSTVSDVTQFYNSMNMTGFAFDPDALIPEPPPYSEDPPPPYTELFVPVSDGSQGGLASQASDQVFSQDILY